MTGDIPGLRHQLELFLMSPPLAKALAGFLLPASERFYSTTLFL